MNKLTKNYIYNSAYQLLAIIIPLITTPYLTRTLGKSSLGIDSYVLSIVQLTEVIGTLGTNLYANREIAYVRDNKKKLSTTFLEILILRIVLCVAVSCIYSGIALHSDYKVVFFIQAITVISYFLDLSWFFIGIEEMKPVVIRNICVKILVTIGIFSFIRKSEDLYLYVGITAGGQALGTFLMFVQCKKMISFAEHDKLNIKRHIKPVLALFLPQAASTLYVQFDKTMLGLLATDISCVSIYDKAESLVKTPMIFATAMTAVIMPRVANEFALKHHEKVKELISISIDFMLLLFLPIMIGMSVIASSFVPWYLGNAYQDSIVIVRMLSPIILAIALSNVSGSQYLVASKGTKYLTISYVSGAVFNLIGNYLLIPVFNEKGAAFTTLIAECMVTCIQFYAMHKSLGSMQIMKKSSKKLLAAVVMTMVIIPIGFIGQSILIALIQVLAGAVAYFLILLLLKDESIIEALKKAKTRFIQ